MKKKVLATSMLAVMFALTACGGNETDTASDYTESADISLPLQETMTLNILTQSSPLAPADPNDKLIWQRYEDETNVHINWTNYSNDVFAEKRNLKIASNELPDAIFDAGLSDYDILSYAEDEVIIPVEDLIDNHMPNLKKIFDENPEYRDFVTAPDGHIYTFPWIEELGAGKDSIHSVANIPWINQTWLNNLGLEMPTTTDELANVLQQFKEKDADGDGDPNNELPISFIYGDGGNSNNFLYGSFGYGDNGDHIVVNNDGEVVYTLADEGYKEAVKYMNELYTKGLVDKEVFTQDWNTYASKGKSQKYGMYFTWDMGNVSGFTSGDYSDPDNIVSDYVAMPPLAGPDGNVNVNRSNGFGLDRGRMVICADNQNPILTAKWIDGLYAPLQSVQDNWGTYGDETQANIFELDGNMLKHLPLNGTAPSELRQKTSVSGPLAILDEYYGEYVTLPDDAAWRMNILSTVYVPYMQMDNNYPRVFMTDVDQKEITDIEVSLNEYAMAMQADFIKNGNVDARWDEYLAELDKLKLGRFLEMKQQYYDAIN